MSSRRTGRNISEDAVDAVDGLGRPLAPSPREQQTGRTAASRPRGGRASPTGLTPIARPPTAESGGRVPLDQNGRPAFGPVRRFGEYTLIKKLATGGMAEIWLARRSSIAGFSRFVVVKKILSNLAEQETFVRMFLDEARTSSMLNHPNIVQIYDLGEAEGTYYIAMEYIAGENLAAIAWRGMKRGRPFPPTYAARVIAHACKALHYAHTLRGNDRQPLEIVHRDVSPQNILVTYEGEVKLVDFGIAKAATKSEHTKTGMLKGKFSYMSPEQCLGDHVDHRSDIFALGILLYELCTGKRLFKHESELMILDMITKRHVIAPSKVTPDISPVLEDIIMRALEKDVEARFESAQEMQLSLEGYLRTLRDPVTDADVSAYMHTLFSDKIEEKRRLRERASRDDFEALFLEPDAPLRRRTVYGPSPGAVQVMGTPAHPGFPVSPGVASPYGPYPPVGPGSAPTGAYGVPRGPNGVSGPPFGASSGTHGSSSGAFFSGQEGSNGSYGAAFEPYPGPSPFVTRFITIAALIIIVVAGTTLYHHLRRTATFERDTTQYDPGKREPKEPLPSGAITIESSPSEASIYLDGRAMAHADGSEARTPSDLKGLIYGREYAITLTKEGYRPFVTNLVMGEDADGKSHLFTLEPFPGRLITEVRGTSAEDVRIFYDGEAVGRGPFLSKELASNTTVLVEATLPGRVCRVEPRRVRILPTKTARTMVECVARRRRRPSPAPKAARKSAPRVAQKPKAPAGCTTRDDLPPGLVTIDTKPWSTVYWGERKLGETPIAEKRLPAGCLLLRAVGEDGRSRTVRVEVEPNLTRSYRFEL